MDSNAVRENILRAYEQFFSETPLALPETTDGSGVYGSWQVDQCGQPRYEYSMDHVKDKRAGYHTSSGDSSDHWHLVGNDRITALAHNEGYVEVMDWDRAGKYLNKWEPKRHQYAGGYKYIESNGYRWNTLWSQLPDGATQRRFFGIGYFEKHTSYDGLQLVERIEAPPGNLPALLSTSRITNNNDSPQQVTLTEFWTANLHVLLPALVMTHQMKGLFTAWRRRFNKKFSTYSHVDEQTGVLWTEWRLKNPAKMPARNLATWGDYHPNAAFLVCLDNNISAKFATDGDAFLSGNTVSTILDHPVSSLTGNVILAAERTFTLEPGETRELHYLYGYAQPDTLPGCLDSLKKQALSPPPRARIELIAPDTDWLNRELHWHSYYLQANTIYQEYNDCHVVDQGSAYSMLHGALGAHRDFALFTLPLIYLRPDLAREMLKFSMTSQDAHSGALPYAHIGFGKQSGAGVHASSSDLDLFFLWSSAEYLGATRDFSLLDEDIPYSRHTSNETGTGMEHLQAAFRHLKEKVGTGKHGMIRCGTGDWNDALVGFSKRKLATIRKGESLLNAGLAALVLPNLSTLIQDSAPEFAEELQTFGETQSKVAMQLWNGKWWSRGYLGVGDRMLGSDNLFLDCQAFPTLAGLLDAKEQQALLQSIQEKCVHPEPHGATALAPPMKGLFLQPGADTNGGIWAAVNSWTAWLLSAIDPKVGWDFFLRTTMKQRAEAYPDIWYGIWSGPDAFNASCNKHPGETYNHVVTPMTDFPIMNANYHAGPLLNIIRMAGIEVQGNTLCISPRLPFNSFVFRSPLVGVAFLPDACRGYYTPVADGTFAFRIHKPSDSCIDNLRLTVDDLPVAYTIENDFFCFSVNGLTGQRIQWEIK